MTAAIDDVLACEAAWTDAFLGQDVERLRSLMREDCTIAHGSGAVEPRDAFLANLFGRIDVRSSTSTEREVRVFSEVAIVTALVQQELRLVANGGGFAPAHASTTKVWIRNGDRWQLLRMHNTRRSA